MRTERELGTYEVNPGRSWSPDGVYVTGTSSPSFNVFNLRLMRANDDLSLILNYANGQGQLNNYRELDWR